MYNIEEIKDLIIEKLRPLNPETVILFGSYAYGNPREDSDIDIYVVTNDDFIPSNFKENSKLKLKISRALDSLRNDFAIDIIVHTKLMAELFKKQNSSLFQEINKYGRIIYE